MTGARKIAHDPANVQLDVRRAAFAPRAVVVIRAGMLGGGVSIEQRCSSHLGPSRDSLTRRGRPTLPVYDLTRCVRGMALILILVGACGGEMERQVTTPPDAPPADALVHDAAVATACMGTPASCASFALSLATDCQAQSGCVADFHCRADLSFSCFSQATESACSAVGCSWTSQCESNGTGNLCFVATTQTDCAAKPGCFWDSFCDPLSDPTDPHCAAAADETSCKNTTACEWGYQSCSGTPAACSTLNEAACQSQHGCQWMP